MTHSVKNVDCPQTLLILIIDINDENIPTDFICNGRIKRHDPETESQLVLDLKTDLTTQSGHNSATHALHITQFT